MANQNGTSKNNACRKLFQDDSEPTLLHNLENETNELHDRNLEEAKLKWNFDFKNGVPLEGDWVWEKVEENRGNAYGLEEECKENHKPNP